MPRDNIIDSLDDIRGPGTGKCPGWMAEVQTDSNAEPRPNLYNAMLALRQDPSLSDLFGYDEMLQATILLRPIPWKLPKNDQEAFSPRPVKDADVSALQELLQASGLEKIGKEVMHQAVDLRATERAFHPVRDYLDGLKWDGQARISKWTNTYLGADDNEYHRAIGQMFLVSMVARIYEPGCQVDYMPVLEGLQGELKSSACRILAGDDYFSDNLPPIGSDPVRVSHHMRGKWLIEIAEMSAMSKADSADLKAFITRRYEQYTPKYGRKEVIEPRQCVFIGTTNKDTYLHDETGGRRFWPIKTGCIDLAALRRDRDQLFAEAVRLYRQNAKWWPDREFERKFIAPVQESRFEADAWEQAIATWANTPDSNGVLCTRTTILEVAHLALKIDTAKLTITDQRRIKASLARIGWKEGNRTGTGRWWVLAGSH
jgi:predicted P-loop ATPase